MVLRNGFITVAQKLQEAADKLSQGDVRTRLSDAVADAHRGTDNWAYYVDHIGDAESGDCIYTCSGDMRSAPYEISTVGGKATVHLDTDNATNVVPRTSYEEEADEDDHYAGMEESFEREKLYAGGMPVFERFISKSERAGAGDDDFAGKGKSFPILKPGDVKAAVHAMGRAGSGNYGMAQLKANIVKIANKKGWGSSLPKSWRGDSVSEGAAGSGGTRYTGSRRGAPGANTQGAAPCTDASQTADERRASEASGNRETFSQSIKISESAPSFCSEIQLSEASRTHYPIKIISPGTGSSAHYTESVLKASANKFGAGTLMFWNHPTSAEESARPEGNLDHLAAITTKPAEWRSDGPKGPGLYAEAKVMADYATKVEERAPHIGLSIRAGGTAGKKSIDGKPVLESIDYVESVDYVTKAGRGGLALAEAARGAGIILTEGPTGQENEMTEADVKKLIESATATATAPLLERAVRGDATAMAGRILESATLPPAAKQRIIERATQTLPKTATGELDGDKFREQLLKEAKDEAAYLASITGAGRVFGLGASAGAPSVELTEAEEKRARKQAKRDREAAELLESEAIGIFADLMGGDKKAAEAAVKHAA